MWYNISVKKRAIQIALTLLFSVVAVALALRGIDFQDVRTALAQVDWAWISVTLLLILGTLFIRAVRWRILLGRAIPLKDAFGLINIGYLISGVLPLRAGDPTRAVGASLRSSVSAIAALSTVVVERVLDMLVVIIILLATLPLVPHLQSYLSTGQVGGGLSFNLILILSSALAFGILLAFVLIAAFPNAIERLARNVLIRLQINDPDKWLQPLRGLTEGLSALRSPKDGILIGLWSIVLWSLTATYFMTTMWACRTFIPTVSLLESLVATWASAFGMAFPATGGIGSFHFAVREVLFWGFGIPRDLGFAYAVIVHALPYLMGIGIGALTLLLWGMSPSNLIQRGQEIEETMDPL